MFPTRCNYTQFIYFWKTALHVSEGISIHHQEHIQLYVQYLVLVKPLLLPVTIVDLLELVWVWCGNFIDLLWCGCWRKSATAPKQINKIPTSRKVSSCWKHIKRKMTNVVTGDKESIIYLNRSQDFTVNM